MGLPSREVIRLLLRGVAAAPSRRPRAAAARRLRGKGNRGRLEGGPRRSGPRLRVRDFQTGPAAGDEGRAAHERRPSRRGGKISG